MNKKIKYAVSLLLALILLVQIAPCAIAEDMETPADDPTVNTLGCSAPIGEHLILVAKWS